MPIGKTLELFIKKRKQKVKKLSIRTHVITRYGLETARATIN